MTANEFLKNITSDPKGVFLLFGDEEYTKLSCLTKLREAMFEGGDDPFNHHKILCTEAGWEDKLLDAVDSLPVFCEKKLVELHSLPFSALSDAQTTALLELFENAKKEDDTVLVVYALGEELNAGTPKKPSAIYKKLTSVLEPVQCERQTPGRLAGWVGRHFAAEGVVADAMVCQELVQRCGTDMFFLANEVQKLAYFTLSKKETKVDLQDIALVCCTGNDSGSFDFSNAILEGNAPRALQLLVDMRRRKEKPEWVLGSIIDLITSLYLIKRLLEAGKKNAEIASATGINEYRVKLYVQGCTNKSAPRLQKALTLCTEADRKIKNSGLDNYTVLEILVLRLCRM